MNPNPPDSPFAEGYQAAQRDAPLTANPYTKGREWREWRKGHRTALKDRFYLTERGWDVSPRAIATSPHIIYGRPQ